MTQNSNWLVAVYLNSVIHTIVMHCCCEGISILQCQISVTQTVTPFSWIGNINRMRCQLRVSSVICYVKRPHISDINTRSLRSTEQPFENMAQ